MNPRRLHIITSFFTVRVKPGSFSFGASASPEVMSERQAEYLWCIFQNALHPSVAKLHLIIQDDPSVAYLQRWKDFPLLKATGKLATTLFPRSPQQPLYSDLFQYANNTVPLGELAMVTNADIFLDSDFVLPKFADENLDAFALTRWESPGVAPLITEYRGSHDSFIFKPPLPKEFIESVQHPQNAYKAENIVIYELQRHRTVKNPCKSVRVYHKHAADFRQWLPPQDDEANERYARAYPE